MIEKPFHAVYRPGLLPTFLRFHNGLVIIVTTRKGDVRLVGVVDTQRQIDTAIKLAQRADGFHTIHNELIIRK